MSSSDRSDVDADDCRKWCGFSAWWRQHQLGAADTQPRRRYHCYTRGVGNTAFVLRLPKLETITTQRCFYISYIHHGQENRPNFTKLVDSCIVMTMTKWNNLPSNTDFSAFKFSISNIDFTNYSKRYWFFIVCIMLCTFVQHWLLFSCCIQLREP